MKIELKELNAKTDQHLYHFLQEIGPDENGFMNSAYGLSEKEFNDWLKRMADLKNPENLPENYVPQTIYWLYIDDFPVGMGKLRHYLNENLLINGGNIGYGILKSQRGKGYGRILLEKLLQKAKSKNLKKVLLTVNKENISSRRVIEANNCLLKETVNGKCYYWKNLEEVIKEHL